MNNPTNQMTTAMQFFGYRYPPFADTFEIHTPFQSKEESLLVQRALALLRQGKSIALYGEAGSGKSMLVKTITMLLDPKEFRIALIPYGGIRPFALLRDLCDEFDINVTGKKNLLSRLAADFKRSANKPFPLIVVDEAHEMPRQSFLDLCSLLHDAQTRTTTAALILIGQPVLKKILELDIYAPVKTRLCCLFTMPKLTIDDARDFIHYRLKLSHASPNLFDPDAINCIAADTKGNRRTLMNLAALCLEEAAFRNDKVVTAELVTSINLQLHP
jgi:type II secretory pathway predicted ATPase ExeA